VGPWVIAFDQCTNGGTTCGTDRTAALIVPVPYTFAKCSVSQSSGCQLDQDCPVGQTCQGPKFRVNSWPMIAVDNRPEGNGLIYLVWADYRSGNADIYFTRGSADGTTWAPAKIIASNPYDEFFPTISVSLHHFIYVTFYRRTSTSPSVHTFNLYEIYSADFGDSFSPPVQINDGGNIAPLLDQYFIGDYNGLDTVYTRDPAWMDSRNNDQDVYTTMVGGC
jgi:hypothetical protein